jgi:hypothetical protein
MAIHTAGPEIRDGEIGVLSYRDYFTSYRQHPERKTIDPADGEPCHTWTRGLLQARDITAKELTRVGKESNRLADTDASLDEQADPAIQYPPSTRQCRGCDAQVDGRRQWCTEACRKRAARRISRMARQASPGP